MANRNSGLIAGGLIVLALLGGAGYIYTAPEFERTAPVIHSEEHIYWNRSEAIKINLSDDTGLRHFELVMSDGQNSLIVGQGDFDEGVKEQTLSLKYPQSKTLNPKATQLTLKVTATDKSFWEFLQGNKSEKVLNITVDSTRPNVNLLANSYSMTQGGSALVVFQANDEKLDSLSIEAAGNTFKAQPYKKEGYYATLIAWPFDKQDFSAKIVAIDAAKNRRIVEVPLYLKNHHYKISHIEATDKFIDGKITDLASANPEFATINNKIEKLKAVNETMRLSNEKLIHDLSRKVSSDLLQAWKINHFYPLKNGQKVASYGDERHYYYENKGNEVSLSYHVGYDLASTKMALIKTSNAGKVVFAGDNGIYGNMPMIDHGLGLYSLYGHCSQLLVNEGDEVKAGDDIANTGVTGLALGDHLHFGLLVQGVEVRPVEWFDKEWIRKNIDNVFAAADKIVDGK